MTCSSSPTRHTLAQSDRAPSHATAPGHLGPRWWSGKQYQNLASTTDQKPQAKGDGRQCIRSSSQVISGDHASYRSSTRVLAGRTVVSDGGAAVENVEADAAAADAEDPRALHLGQRPWRHGTVENRKNRRSVRTDRNHACTYVFWFLRGRELCFCSTYVPMRCSLSDSKERQCFPQTPHLGSCTEWYETFMCSTRCSILLYCLKQAAHLFLMVMHGGHGHDMYEIIHFHIYVCGHHACMDSGLQEHICRICRMREGAKLILARAVSCMNSYIPPSIPRN
jgi:hypothetical protein